MVLYYGLNEVIMCIILNKSIVLMVEWKEEGKMYNHDKFSVNPDILRWAIKESNRDDLEISEKFPYIDEWISKEKEPTLRQLEEFANFTYVPFGYMFLSRPPRPYRTRTEFRTINNKLPNMSKNLKDTVKDMELKQDWMIEHRRDLGYERLDILEKFDGFKDRYKNDYKKIAKISLDLIDMDFNKNLDIKDGVEFYKILREKLELVGISVFQNGVVLQNNYRTLDVREFRAFALPDKIAPLIFINNNDSNKGKVFSLIHEYIHILYNRDDIYEGNNNLNEILINNITAEVLMPEEYILNNWNEDLDELEQINKLTRELKVSKHALAIRLLHLKLVNKDVVEVIVKETEENIKMRESKKDSGGNYYNTLNSRLSSSFKTEVINSIEVGETPYTVGTRLLNNISGKVYRNLERGV